VTPAAAFLVIWAILAVYSVLTAIDLGAGAYLAWAELTGDAALWRVVDRYATPVWESVHSFLILLLLAMEAFFPRAINLYAQILLVPLAATFALLAVRQVGFAMRHEVAPLPGRAGRLWRPLTIGGAGLLAPLPAMTFLSVVEGKGFSVVHGVPRFSIAVLLGQPLTLAFMALALASELYMAAAFLRYFADLMGEAAVVRRLRRAAFVFGAAVTAAALVALAVLARQVPSAAEGFGRTAPLWALSLAALVAAGVTEALRRPGPLALILSGVMYLGGYLALGLLQLPYLIRGRVTIAQAFTSPAMAHALGAVLVVGFVAVVLPSAGLLTGYLFASARRRAQAGVRPPG
jgi:cytochrome bd-type quinol oxidase subunit 2